MTRARKTSLSFCVLASFAVAVSCRDPTQVTLHISTGQKCTEISAVDVIVGRDQRETQSRFVDHFSAASTRDCDATGNVGTLVVAPGGGGATILVAVGVQVGGMPAPDATGCTDPETAKRCIIARRTFAFVDHTSLDLPISLDPSCLGRTCDPSSTCFKGACVDSTVGCNGSTCGLAGEVGGPPVGEGGANESGSSDGAYDADLDAMTFEDVTTVDSGDGGTTVMDAGKDAFTSGFDGGAPPCGNPDGGMPYCYPVNGINGVSTAGSCIGGSVTSNCCHCTCPNGTVVGCDIAVMSGSSCQPVCPP